MGKLDGVINALPKASENNMLSIMTTFNQMLQKQMAEGNIAEKLANEVRGELKDVGGKLDERLSKALSKVINDALGSVAKEIAGVLTETIDGFEASMRAEFKAIEKFPKIPEPKDVDLKPIEQTVINAVDRITNAIQSIDIPISGAPQKTHWTFDMVRNKRTGLLEKVEAR